MADPDLPDFYADGLQLAAGPYGLSLTFYLTDPDARPQQGPGTPIARIRVSVALAEAMADVLKTAIADQAKGRTGSSGG